MDLALPANAAQELKFWLSLLCAQNWDALPNHLDPVWLQPGGDTEYCTDKPLRIVMSCLEHAIARLGQRGLSTLKAETQSVLWEIYSICMVVGESDDWTFLRLPFDPKSPQEYLWRGMGRLCCVALADERLQTISQELDFKHFLDSYTNPMGEADLKQFPPR